MRPLEFIPVSIGTGSNAGRYGQDGAARFINCYVEEREDGKNTFAADCVDGLYEFANLPDATAGIDGGIVVDNVLYVKAGRLLYGVNASGEVTTLGGLATDKPSFWARNRANPPQIGVVSDGLYTVIESGVATAVSDPDLAAPNSLAVLDGYFLLPGGDGRWSITGIDDATSIAALDFTTAASNPDEIVRVFSREREAVFLGESSIEWWLNTGNAGFPFERQQAIEVGCKAAGSVARLDRTMCWVADDNTVRIMEGYGAKRISTHQVERDIDAEADPTLIQATSWYDRGHRFYAVHTASTTHVYDLTTGKWHERQSRVSGAMTRWRGSHVFRLGEKLIVGDYATGKLYEMRPDVFDEDGEPLVMTIQPPPVHGYPYKMRFNALSVDVVAGVGVVNGESQDVDPEIMMQFSRDGGHSWSNELWVKIGKANNRLARAMFRRLGTSTEDGYTFRVSCSARVARCIMGMAVAADKLRA